MRRRVVQIKPYKYELGDPQHRVPLMSGVDVNLIEPVFAASSVFSWFGLAYFGIPVAVLMIAALCLSTRTCRTFWLLVSGAVSSIIALFVVVALWENRGRELSDQQLALLANISACVGALVGVVCFRIAHGVARKKETQDCRPQSQASPNQRPDRSGRSGGSQVER